MKICFFAGASSVHSHRWIRYFINAKHNVSWISLDPLNGQMPNVSFHYIGPLSSINPFKVLLQAIKFKKLIRRINPDILHIHSAGTYGLIGMLSNFHPAVVTAWGSEVLLVSLGYSTSRPRVRRRSWSVDGLPPFIKRPMVKYILEKADLITCDADHMKEAISNLKIDKEKVKLVYFGVEPEKFKPGAKNLEILKKWGVNNSPVVISLRNLEPIYDIKTLIESIPIVLKDIPDTKFVIAGAGSQEKYLKEFAQTLKVSDSVSFMGKYVHDFLPTYLNSADIYVSTSLSDAGIAGSTAEAMSCGIPVIITDSGENTKWVQDGENGFVVPVKNPKMLAEKIIYLLKNEKIRKELGLNGRKTIDTKNNYYREMEKMEEFYKMFAAGNK